MLDPWAIQNSHWKKRLAHHLFEARHLTQASCLRALCHSEAIDFKNYGLKNPICVIPNGIDLPSDQESGTGAGVSTRKTLLFLGRIHPKKGLANAIRAFAESRNFHADVRRSRGWRMVIAGWNQGGHQEELVELCQEIGLRYCILGDKPEMDAWKNMGEEIIFFGEVFGDRKKELLRSCDAFILPSLSEGLPMSVLEAWAYGMPVLITAECNLPEGYATQAAIRIESDASGIARGLDQLFSMSRSDLQAMGLRGRRLVQKRFAWKTVSSQMKEVYDWILGGGSSPECVIASEKLKIKYKKANQSSL
jgi:poly(glycerol-phosphate) alpha-glucosyltransferase